MGTWVAVSMGYSGLNTFPSEEVRLLKAGMVD